MQSEGTTIVFVSHGLLGVQGICSRALWLKDGVLERLGPVDEVVQAYESYTLAQDKPVA
jgi:ABC-type polysaccharide/polyol phosphate transport system ATPase subunit